MDRVGHLFGGGGGVGGGVPIVSFRRSCRIGLFLNCTPMVLVIFHVFDKSDLLAFDSRCDGLKLVENSFCALWMV